MNRSEFQQLAIDRIDDAGALLAAQRWSAAYYLAGYAAECAIKSCILGFVQNNPDVVFRERRFSERCWTHDVEELLKLAGLKLERDSDIATNSAFGMNWQVVSDWSPERRYQQITEYEAKRLYNALTDVNDGVFQWIKARW